MKTDGKFTHAFSAIKDDRLRVLLLSGAFFAVLFIVYFPRIFAPGWVSPDGDLQDYAAFYGAAGAALGDVGGNLYDARVFQEAIGAPTSLLWLYPPPMLFLLAPFGLLPFGAAKLAWLATTFLCAYAIGRLASGRAVYGVLTALSPTAFAAAFVGQISAFFGLLLVAGLLLSERRPMIAGALIAVLTLKPQYGLMVIPFLLATRAWKTLAAAAGFSVLMIAASVLVYGADMWRGFFDSLLNGVHAAYYQSGGHPGRITLSDAIKAIGFDAPPAWAIYGPLLLAAVAGLIVLARTASRPMLIAYTLAASALVCPYFFVYDFFIYAAAILLAGAASAMKPLHAYSLAALWAAPLAPFLGGSTVTPAVVWPLGLLAVAVIFMLARNAPRSAPTL